MNVKEILASHKSWKDKLRIAMATREPIDLDEVRSDRCCELGNWLYGEGKHRFGHLPEYELCRLKHALFHQAAETVAGLINQGHLLEADKMLANSSSMYSQTSEALGKAVITLFQAEKIAA
jgi:methyl-accepting chemotaxis protein